MGSGESSWHLFLRPCILSFSGLGVSIKSVAHPSAASVPPTTDAKDVNLMPNIEIATPVSSAPTDRLALGVSWVRPGAGSIGGTLNPSMPLCWSGRVTNQCFESNEE